MHNISFICIIHIYDICMKEVVVYVLYALVHI